MKLQTTADALLLLRNVTTPKRLLKPQTAPSSLCMPFPVCAGPAHPVMFTVAVQSLTSSLLSVRCLWPQESSC